MSDFSSETQYPGFPVDMHYITITPHPTLSKIEVNDFSGDPKNEIDYYHKNSLMPMKAVIMDSIFNNNPINIGLASWVGSDFDRGSYNIYHAIYSSCDAVIKDIDLLLERISAHHSYSFYDFYSTIERKLIVIKDREMQVMEMIDAAGFDVDQAAEVIDRISFLYAANSIKNCLHYINKIIDRETEMMASIDAIHAIAIRNILFTHGIGLASIRHFRFCGSDLVSEEVWKKNPVYSNLLKFIKISYLDGLNSAMIIANFESENQISFLSERYKEINGGSAPIPRLIPLIEDVELIDNFIKNYDNISRYLISDKKEIMIAGSDITKNSGFIASQNALYGLLNVIKKQDNKSSIFIGSGTTVFRSGSQSLLSSIRHAMMQSFQSNLGTYNRTFQGGGISFEGLEYDDVLSFLRSEALSRSSDGLLNSEYDNTALNKISDISYSEYRQFLSQNTQLLNDLISGPSSLTPFGLGVIYNIGGSRDKERKLFPDYIESARAIQYYSSLLDMGLPAILFEIPANQDLFSSFLDQIKSNVNNKAIQYILYIMAVQIHFYDSRLVDLAIKNPAFIDQIRQKLTNLERIIDACGFSVSTNSSVVAIVAQEWRIGEYMSIDHVSLSKNIKSRQNVIYCLIKLRNYFCKKIIDEPDLKNNLVMVVKKINILINNVRWNGVYKKDVEEVMVEIKNVDEYSSLLLKELKHELSNQDSSTLQDSLIHRLLRFIGFESGKKIVGYKN